MAATIRRVTVEDVAELAPKLRKADRDEIACAYGVTPEEGLWYSFYSSTMCWSIVVGEDVVGIFGCGDCCPWLVGSDRLVEAGMTIARQGPRYIEFMLRQNPILYNYVDVRNDVAIKWLKWLGFSIMPPMPHGLKGEMFHPFFMFSIKETAKGPICAFNSLA